MTLTLPILIVKIWSNKIEAVLKTYYDSITLPGSEQWYEMKITPLFCFT